MKITALRMHNVRRFARQGVAIEGIGDGVNVLCAANEFGKSTSFAALHALFFQSHASANRDVKRLQPYGGGNPLVEADILMPDGRYRLTKQFIGGRRATVENLDSGRLVAQADEAEGFIAGLIRGGTAGPAGLLWVRQGITGLEERDRKEEEGERRVREGLLSSVQGEVEAITGGRRMAEIMAACADELARLATATLRPKAGGPYAAAVDERARLAAEEQRLRGQVEALRAALDGRAAAARRLAEVERAEEKAARRAAVETAEAGLQRARSQGDAVKALAAEAALARAERDARERELAGFREAKAAESARREDLRASDLRRQDALARRGAASIAIEAAQDAVRAAEAEEREARDLLARLDAALSARQAAEQARALGEQLTRAESVRARLEAGEAALGLLAISAEAIDKLEQAEIEIARLRAVEAASLPTLSIAYDPGATQRLRIDGAELADGEERGVAGQASLSIPGIGTLTLRANRPPGGLETLTAALARRDALLGKLAVAGLAEARGRQAQAAASAAELETLRQTLRLLAPEGLARLREEVARRGAAAAAAAACDGDPEAARARYAQAGDRVRAAREGAGGVQPAQARAVEDYIAAETACAALRGELLRLDALLGPQEQREGREQALMQAAAAAQEQFGVREARLAAQAAGAPELASAEAMLRRAKSVETAAAEEENALRQRLAELNAAIRIGADEAVEEVWRETAEALAAVSARASAYESEVAALERLRAALQRARTSARELYLQPVLAELRPLLGLLFDDVAIEFDETTLLPQAISRNGQKEDIDRLSGGMREQLSVLTRLAFARLLARDGRPAPVILDDALVFSDDDRIERMFDALHRQASDQQIIVFSCRQRAFSRLGGTVLRMVPWQPATS